MGTMRHCLREASKALLRRPATSFFAITTIALSLFLAGVIWLTGRSIDRVSKQWAKGAVVSVYLRDGATPSEKSRIERSLKALPGFHGLQKINKKQARKRLRKNLGGDATVLRGVETEWLPESFQVTLRGRRTALLQAQDRLTSMGQAFTAIEEVRTVRQWHRRLDRLAHTLRTASGVLLVLTLLVCGFVVTSTVRLGLLSRRDELEIQKILGATGRFVAAPVLLEGAIQALTGSLVAVGFLYGLYSITVPQLTGLLGAGWDPGAVQFFAPSTLIWGVLLATVVGLLGSRLAVGRGGAHG